MVPRDLPSMLFHILELKNPNSASNFGLQSDPRRFFLIFYHLTLNLTLKVKPKSRRWCCETCPACCFNILKLTNPNSASNFGLQSYPRRFFLDFLSLDLEFDLEGQTQKSSMVPRDLPSMLFHILELKNPNSSSNFGLQSDPRRFFLIFIT